MVIRNWKDVIDMDWPKVEITERTRAMAPIYAQRYSTRNVRLATGRIITDEEMEQRRREAYQPLP
jgi:hypothetical protein